MAGHAFNGGTDGAGVGKSEAGRGEKQLWFRPPWIQMLTDISVKKLRGRGDNWVGKTASRMEVCEVWGP